MCCLPRATPLKKADSPSSHSYQLTIDPQLEVELPESPPDPHWNLSRLDLVQVLCTQVQFMRAITLSSTENTIFRIPPSPLPLIIFLPLYLQWPLSPQRHYVIDITFKSGYSTIHCTLTKYESSVHCKKRLL